MTYRQPSNRSAIKSIRSPLMEEPAVKVESVDELTQHPITDESAQVSSSPRPRRHGMFSNVQHNPPPLPEEVRDSTIKELREQVGRVHEQTRDLLASTPESTYCGNCGFDSLADYSAEVAELHGRTRTLLDFTHDDERWASDLPEKYTEAIAKQKSAKQNLRSERVSRKYREKEIEALQAEMEATKVNARCTAHMIKMVHEENQSLREQLEETEAQLAAAKQKVKSEAGRYAAYHKQYRRLLAELKMHRRKDASDDYRVQDLRAEVKRLRKQLAARRR